MSERPNPTTSSAEETNQAPQRSCCSVEEQRSCCAPEAKSACCAPQEVAAAQASSCGCR